MPTGPSMPDADEPTPVVRRRRTRTVDETVPQNPLTFSGVAGRNIPQNILYDYVQEQVNARGLNNQANLATASTSQWSYRAMRDLQIVDEMDETFDSTQPLPPEAAPEPEPQFLQIADNDHLTRLQIARDKTLQEYDYREELNINFGRRESEYFNMLKSQKKSSVRATEIVYSEVPQLLARLNKGMLDEIRSKGLCMGIVVKNRKWHFLCASCNLDTPPDFAFFCNGNVWCAEHVPNLDICSVCRELQPNCTPIKNIEDREVRACGSCMHLLQHGHLACNHCHNPIPNDGQTWVGTGRCPRCINETRRDGAFRNFSRNLNWVSKDKGAIVRSTRIFSCEIEAMAPSSGAFNQLSSVLPVECGLSTDGSIHGDEHYDGYGFEMQTPRLGGKKGEELIRRSAAAMRGAQVGVNKTCGLHIHLDGRGIILPRRKEYPIGLLQLWKAHLVFEDVILSMLPFERRRNDFCRLMASSFKTDEVDMCESLLDVEKLWYKAVTSRDIQAHKEHHYHSSRYFGVNLHSLLGHGHLEIRYHSGTTNGRKILEWANLHALIMDACEKKALGFDFFKEAQATTNLREKTDMLFAKIGMVESSKQYFYSRQKKFADRNNNEATIAEAVPQQPPPRTTRHELFTSITGI